MTDMGKQEFLDTLRAALASRVSASIVAENIRYYEEYINTQMRMGKREDEVLGELGDPRLLARSIAEANKNAETGRGSDAYYGSPEDGAGHYGGGPAYRGRSHRMPVWLIVLLAVFVVVLVLSAVFSVLSFLAPVLLPILCVLLLVKLFERTS